MQNTNSGLSQMVDTAPATAYQPAAPATRAGVNRANAQHSTGPRTEAGKAKASANSLKHGFFSSVDHLDPEDAPSYQTAFNDLRQGMRPADPAEEQAVRELATFRTRLLRLQSIEYVLLCSEIEPGTPSNPDPTEFELTAAFLNNEAQLTRLSKAEAHLQRAYNRTWDRLLRLQKDRRKLAENEIPKRSQLGVSDCQKTAATGNIQREAAAQTVAPLLQPIASAVSQQRLGIRRTETGLKHCITV